MKLLPEKNLNQMLYKYLKENRGKAYTIEALETILKKALHEFNKSDRSKTLLEILNLMKNNEIINSIENNGELHYFFFEIYDYDQYKLHKTQYFVPDTFISAGKGSKKIKIRFCKVCKKEVILERRKMEQKKYVFTSYLDPRNIEARRNSGWFCPNCGRKF